MTTSREGEAQAVPQPGVSRVLGPGECMLLDMCGVLLPRASDRAQSASVYDPSAMTLAIAIEPVWLALTSQLPMPC